jgi:2-keto-3-deoxy-L-rhamnonate aldolase RhmA
MLQKMARGEVVVVCNPSFTYSWRVTEMVGRMGFDGCWIDMEHRDFGYQEAATMILAARATDMDTVVRIRKDSYADYFRPLEDGATGIMVPHVKTRAEAEFAVYNAKYAPVGRRGMDGVGADTFYGLGSTDLAEANRETFVMIQLEDYEGMDNIAEIVGTEGIAGVLVGPADLSQSYGKAGQFDCEEVKQAMLTVAATCREHGKWWGAPGIDADYTRRLIGNGAQFIALGSDYHCLLHGFQRYKSDFDELLRAMDR